MTDENCGNLIKEPTFSFIPYESC